MTGKTRRLLEALAVLSGVLAAGVAVAAPPRPSVAWSPCYRDVGPNFECGMVNVPLDHLNPGLAAIQIALVRLPATGPEARIGSLFVNPGGPGGSGVDFVLGAGPVLYTEELRARFDIVGFDPRGVARSTPLRCFGTDRQWWFAPFNFPMTAGEEEYWRATDLFLIDHCDQRAGRILDHMSTADVARDLDLLRQAVGDEKLTYAGYSYGSYLGVTYANLFPENVRALVVDGVLDPVAWATGTGDGDTVPFTTRLRSDAGAQQTLEEFFRLCDAGGPACAFWPGARERFKALAEYFLAGNQVLVTLPSGAQRIFTYDRLIGRTLSSMYDPYSWPLLARVLLRIEEAVLEASPAASAAAGAALQAFWEDIGLVTKRGVPRYQNFAESFTGVGCADSDNPGDWRVWGPAGVAADAQYGYFGRTWTWASSPCADWPASQASRYTGPFTATTGFPVLVATTRNDPATRYEGAARVHDLLFDSRLVIVEGWGHCSFFLSAAADQAVSDYLVHQRFPGPEDERVWRFQPDYVPFQAAGAMAPAQAASQGAKVTGREKRRMVTGAMVPDFVRMDAQ